MVIGIQIISGITDSHTWCPKGKEEAALAKEWASTIFYFVFSIVRTSASRPTMAQYEWKLADQIMGSITQFFLLYSQKYAQVPRGPQWPNMDGSWPTRSWAEVLSLENRP